MHVGRKSAQEYVSRIKAYLDADRTHELKAAIGTYCSMQTIRNLASGKIDAEKSTVFKNGILQKICSKLPDLRIENHYTAYKGFFHESMIAKDHQEEIYSYEGVYDVFHNKEESGIEIKRIIILCSTDPFFPTYYMHIEAKENSDQNDGFIFNSQNKIIMFGVSEKYIANITFENTPSKIFTYEKKLEAPVGRKTFEEKRVSCFKGTIKLENVITGNTYFSAALFLQRDRNAKISKEKVYENLDDVSYFY